MMDSHVKGELEMRQAVTRLVNITKGKTAVEIRPELFTEEAEKNLYAALEKQEKKLPMLIMRTITAAPFPP